MKSLKVLLLLLLTLISFAASGAGNPPNILFVFIDDSGWGDFSCYGSSVTTKQGGPITPNIDRMASQGMRFTQGYVAAPICSPSRTAVLTGIEPVRYAIYSFLNNKAANASRNMADWVQPDTVTAPRLFKQAGYTTGQFGKWHMGNGRDVNDAPPPSAYGFDQSLVAFEGNGDRLLYWNNDGSKYGLSLSNEDATVGTYQYCYFYEAAGKHTDAALKFMTNAVNAGKPFYMHVPYNDTHSPYNVPPGQENDFDHITTDTEARAFLGELHNLDKQIGRLINTVDGLGIATNTLIVLVGDNGAAVGESFPGILNRNGGLRSGKGNIYEGGIRVAFIARHTGLIPAGVVNSTTAISTLDLLPTYCSLAGIPLPNAPFAGEDMSDVLRGSTRPRSRPLFWEFGSNNSDNPNSPELAIRDGNYKFLRNPDGTQREFYLVPQDHAEGNNLVSQAAYSQVVSNLESQLMTWYQQNVLGEAGETYSCQGTNFTGPVISDAYTVTGGNSPSTGFGSTGINYQLASRLSGAAAASISGYRLGTTAGRVASDFSIATNRLAAAAKDGNCRFEFSPDGTMPFNFGPWLAGRTYELSVQMDISYVGVNYAQRMSLSLSDTSDAAVGAVDLGLQIGKETATTLGVWKRLSQGAVNTKVQGSLAIGTPINLTLRVTDFNENTADVASAYTILVNGTTVNSGAFRYDTSTTSRYLIFDVAAHEGPVYYDNLQLTVVEDGSVAGVCRKPILSLSELNNGNPGSASARLFWTAQPGLTVAPEFSPNLTQWFPVTNASGAPLSLTTSQGSMQWLNVSLPATSTQSLFFRLLKQ